MDINPDAKPNVIFDLDRIEQPNPYFPYQSHVPLPFPDETFDEIHAYDSFEHYGRQGDWKGLFRGMRELWRVLKPNGVFIGGSPAYNDMWAWGDPGHTRVVSEGTFSYLTKEFYDNNLGITTSSDYRRYVDPYWWKLLHSSIDEAKTAGGSISYGYHWCLQKVTE